MTTTMKRKRESKDRASGAATTTQVAAKAKRAKSNATATAAAPKPILKKPTTPAAPTTLKKPDTANQRPHAKKAKQVEAYSGGGQNQKGEAVSGAAAVGGSGAAVVLDGAPATIQIIAGSYDRALLGVTATIPRTASGGSDTAQFANTFLFNAHTSAIRCLALSTPSVPVPGQGQKIMLATGSTDERINIYHLAAHPPAVVTAAAEAASRRMGSSGGGGGADEAEEERALMASLGAVMPTAENAKNRELGTLLHHASTITRLVFPTRSKLLSASEDSTIAVTRTRDWSLLSTIRAPVPKAGTGASAHRPSGDTAAPGAAPSGVNDFAVHPSMKVMLSVSRGERCMRLWNLVTGRKAGVLNFGRELLRDLGEGKHAAGEGRQVVWGRVFGGGNKKEATAAASDEYAIGFDRNVVVFGMDSLPRCKVLSDPRTKTHDFQYVEVDDEGEGEDEDNNKTPVSLLAVATEDGRILLCSTRTEDVVEVASSAAAAAAPAAADSKKTSAAPPLPCARLIGVIGGQAAGVTGRVKAFKVLTAMEAVADDNSPKRRLQKVWYVVTASSAGALRIWKLTGQELRAAWTESRPIYASSNSSSKDNAPTQLGQLLGTYQTQDRITCVEAFVMIPRPEGLEEDEFEDEGGEEDDEDDKDDEDDE